MTAPGALARITIHARRSVLSSLSTLLTRYAAHSLRYSLCTRPALTRRPPHRVTPPRHMTCSRFASSLVHLFTPSLTRSLLTYTSHPHILAPLRPCLGVSRPITRPKMRPSLPFLPSPWQRASAPRRTSDNLPVCRWPLKSPSPSLPLKRRCHRRRSSLRPRALPTFHTSALRRWRLPPSPLGPGTPRDALLTFSAPRTGSACAPLFLAPLYAVERFRHRTIIRVHEKHRGQPRRAEEVRYQAEQAQWRSRELVLRVAPATAELRTNAGTAQTRQRAVTGPEEETATSSRNERGREKSIKWQATAAGDEQRA